jgi:uncharacterized protein (TIGR02996 family)
MTTDPLHPTAAALVAAVRANPSDSLPRLVYADWLDEQGDPPSRLVAEYIRVETELAGVSQDDPRGVDLIGRLIDLATQSPTLLGGWEYATDLDRIRQKMDALRAADPTMVVFGARPQGQFGHGYHLNPPLRETDLLRFETQLGFLLPADYRAFLLHVGNGLMGPYYGLTPLNLAQAPHLLRRPFPFTREQAALSQAASAHNELRFEDDHEEDGHLHLSEIGCGIYDMLAVSGETRGCVWTSGGVCELYLTVDIAATGRGFLDWYERWLDESLN